MKDGKYVKIIHLQKTRLRYVENIKTDILDGVYEMSVAEDKRKILERSRRINEAWNTAVIHLMAVMACTRRTAIEYLLTGAERYRIRPVDMGKGYDEEVVKE